MSDGAKAAADVEQWPAAVVGSFEPDGNSGGQDYYMSIVAFGTVAVAGGPRRPVVVKKKFRDPELREMFRIDDQFHNEILMYERILPFLLACRGPAADALPTLPRYHYGRNACGESVDESLIVLENAGPSGYRSCDDRVFMNHDHLSIAIRALAKFHALSYTAKHVDPVGFGEVVAGIRDTEWRPDGQWKFDGDAMLRFGRRGVDRLLERDGDGRYREGNEHMRRFIELLADGNGSLRRALRPREPLSVVCHGDFNRNNLLFRYGPDGRPVDALLFDFGTPRYGSPALDLSFFVYMNTTPTARKHRYDDLLDAYCATLAAVVPAGVRAPDRDAVDAEMAASALFGFAHASFFLPYQLDVIAAVDMGPDTITVDGLLKVGGHPGTEYVADMVQHMVEMGYTNV